MKAENLTPQKHDVSCQGIPLYQGEQNYVLKENQRIQDASGALPTSTISPLNDFSSLEFGFGYFF